ncbi:hypothetical protein HanIR_Chr17g0891101 [Helianthus annuus]|nr:hypothetical protein HanIR_Chr17g0891101 [Helianthus annuus]
MTWTLLAGVRIRYRKTYGTMLTTCYGVKDRKPVKASARWTQAR